MILTEIIGYSASFFIVMSFVLRNITHIRLVNLIGCIFFVAYGVMSGILWPIIIPNAVICFVQAYYLFLNKKD